MTFFWQSVPMKPCLLKQVADGAGVRGESRGPRLPLWGAALDGGGQGGEVLGAGDFGFWRGPGSGGGDHLSVVERVGFLFKPLRVADRGVILFCVIEADEEAAHFCVGRQAEFGGILFAHAHKCHGYPHGPDDGGCATGRVWIAGVGACALSSVVEEDHGEIELDRQAAELGYDGADSRIVVFLFRVQLGERVGDEAGGLALGDDLPEARHCLGVNDEAPVGAPKEGADAVRPAADDLAADVVRGRVELPEDCG